MKNIVLYILATTIIFSPENAEADTTFHTRLLIHSHRTIRETNFGIAGWIIAPNISSSPNTWLGIAGPRYNGYGWNAELLAGVMFNSGDANALADLRVELTAKFWGVPLYSWDNFQWINTGKSGTGYWYSQLDWVVPSEVGLLGVETENTFNASACDFSIAPHAVLSLSEHFVLVTAPQLHFDLDGHYTGLQVWIRAVINL